MGLNTRGQGGSNKTFINVYQGNLVLEHDTEDDLKKKVESLGLDPENIQVRQRTKGKNEGKDVYYYVLYDVSGMLEDISINETDFGDFVNITISDVDEKFVISLGDVYSRISKDLIRRLGNIDLNKEIVFGVWSMSAEESSNGKAYSGVRLYQDEEKIEYSVAYEDLPEPEKKKKGRKDVWDYTEQESFLYNILADYIEDNFSSNKVNDSLPEKKEEVKSKPVRREPVTSKEEVDDLPF